MSELDQLERQFPWIKWREPIRVNGRFGCRICIAKLGLKAVDVRSLPRTARQAREHITREHILVARRTSV